MVTDDGKAAVFIPGIKSVDDIAYIAVEQPGAPLVWRRTSASHSQTDRTQRTLRMEE